MVSAAGKRFIAASSIDILALAFGYFALVPDDIPYIPENFDLWAKLGGAIIIILIVLLSKYVLTYRPVLKQKDKYLSTFFKDHLRMIEEDIEQHAAGDPSVRANIMRSSTTRPWSEEEFNIAYYHSENDYVDGELKLKFSENQGVVGHTYASGTESIAVSRSQISGWPDGWSTTGTQDAVTNHLETIIGIPVYRPSDDNEEADPVAVLIIDSEDPFDSIIQRNGRSIDEALKHSEIGDKLRTHASNIGILL